MTVSTVTASTHKPHDISGTASAQMTIHIENIDKNV